MGLLILIAIVAVAALAVANQRGANALSHAQVEKTIEDQTKIREQQFAPLTNVRCNNGKDMKVSVGASYTCTADGGVRLKVTVQDKSGDPKWVWSRSG